MNRTRTCTGHTMAQQLDTRSTMKVAIPHWLGRVSPLFDTASAAALFDVDDGQVVGRSEVTFPSGAPLLRALRLEEAGSHVLICGAISPPLIEKLSAAGVAVYPGVCGPVGEVIDAFVNGDLLGNAAFVMPGYRRGVRVRRRRGRR